MTQATQRRERGEQPRGTARAGFTLIELVVVIIVLGLLSALIYSKGFRTDNAILARQSEIRAQLRYLQLLAMKNGVSSYMGMKCDGTNYWAFSGTTPAVTSTYQLLPGESSKTVSLSGKSMTMSSFTISFDRRGIPYSTDSQVKLAASTSITITASGSTATLTVNPETGFVP